MNLKSRRMGFAHKNVGGEIMVKQILDVGDWAASCASRCAQVGAVLAGLAVPAALTTPAAAQALFTGPCGLTGEVATFNHNQGLTFAPFASGGSINTLVSAINVANTAFLTQSTAFIGSPANPDPWQLGGGVWARGIGGQTDFHSTSTSTYTFGGNQVGGNIACNTTTKLNFAGVQVGADTAELNIDGWNIHGGSTLGYMGANANDFATSGHFNDTLEMPFVGLYGAVTKGGLFLDGQVRWNYYQNTLTDPTNGLFNQNVDARGVSVNGNIGYNYSLPDNWFIEPSAGFIWSETWVDPFHTAGAFLFQPPVGGAVSQPVPGAISVNSISSVIGRASLRVGTSFNAQDWVLQPFATVSGFREFEGDNTASLVTNQYLLTAINPALTFTCTFRGAGVPCVTTGRLSATNIGNYGQFGLGAVAVLPNTGFLAYVRGDYRTGDHIEGWSMNGGIRYQLNPSHPVITGRSADVPAAPILAAYNWTGFYLGPQLGVDWGYTNWTFIDGTKSYPQFAGILPGGQVGYNYQYGKWVFGIEGDAGWTNAHGARPCGPLNAFLINCEINVDALYTVTGRVGYVFPDKLLWYAKGGLAIGEVQAQGRCDTAAFATQLLATGGTLNPGCPSQGSKNTAVGWTVGGGTELALTENWSVKGETSYFNLGSSHYSFGALAGPTGALPVTLTPANVSRSGWISTIGLNYRFTGFGEAPALVAKY